MVILANGVKYNVVFDDDYYSERDSKLIMRTIHKTFNVVENYEDVRILESMHTIEMLQDILDGIATIQEIGDKEEFTF